MSREILQDVIDNFSYDKFIRFFRDKNRLFAPRQESITQYNDENFTEFSKIGEIRFSETQKLLVIASKVNKDLTERSGKKAQYEKAKKILKDLQSYEAGIFIYYNQSNNFRFSLIYDQPIGTKRTFSNFRRFTYFVSPEPGVTNKTFLSQIGEGDFSTLEKVKEAFSIEKVTKEFYNELSYWYFWALKNVTFPADVEKEKNGKNIAVIRLITRLIFIWFMKHKKLIPDYLFSKSKVAEILKDLASNESTYYKAILQNLFFATLNTPIKERKFRAQEQYKGINKDFMDHGIYRYEKYFKNPKDILSLFKNIPFLNGGLFECLDKIEETNNKRQYIRIDGFSDRSDIQIEIPNYLFYQEEKSIDLNKDYGTNNKKYRVRGIIEILQSYNFTIDENTPVDEEIALDPELLGRVFENLLASYNPETATTARKATGSYYTPREIVDYMVTQSLKEYLKSHLPDISEIDKKLDDLLSYNSEANPFETKETNALIELTNKLKVLDPAVGSGAFPMGVLQKLVLLLSKLDPHAYFNESGHLF